jgi:hypothetical protein
MEEQGQNELAKEVYRTALAGGHFSDQKAFRLRMKISAFRNED